MTEINRLIYGKNPLENIVSVEINENFAELFIEKNGEVSSELVENRFWILSNKPLESNNRWVRLKGDLHYKWGKQYLVREQFTRDRFTYSRFHDIFSIYDPKESFLVNFGYRYFKNMKHNEVSILSFDIESSGLYHNSDSFIYIISNTFRRGSTVIRKMFTYDEYKNQGEMIYAWCEWVRSVDPSVICGHNIFGYDLPYLQHVADMNATGLFLGRDSSGMEFDSYDSKFRKDQSQELHYKRAHIYGRNIVDTMFLAVKYDIATKKYDSYGLKHIIAVEGLEVKDRQFYDASKIKDNHTIPEEWAKIKAYALHDADDALALYDLMSPSLFYLSQSVPKSFQSVCYTAPGSQINAILMASYLQDAHSLPKASDVEEYQGAISFGLPGIYRNVLKIDFAGMYPSIMREYKVYDKDKDPNGNFLKIVEYFALYRNKYKKLFKENGEKYYDDMQSMSKIVANSCYGFLGSRGLLFNSPKSASFITAKGRELLGISIKWATGQEVDFWLKKFRVEDESLCDISDN